MPIDEGTAPPTVAEVSLDYTAFFLREFAPVVRTVTLMLRDGARAEEIAQDAFVQLYLGWEKVSRYERPDAWVRRVAIRLAMRAIRRQRLWALVRRDLVRDEAPRNLLWTSRERWAGCRPPSAPRSSSTTTRIARSRRSPRSSVAPRPRPEFISTAAENASPNSWGRTTMSLDRRLRDELEREAAKIDPDVGRSMIVVEARARGRTTAGLGSLLMAAAAVVLLAVGLQALRSTSPDAGPGASVSPTVLLSPSPRTADIAGTYRATLEASDGGAELADVAGEWTMDLRPDGVLLMAPPATFREGSTAQSGVAYSIDEGALPIEPVPAAVQLDRRVRLGPGRRTC